MRIAALLMVLTAACATPNKYYPPAPDATEAPSVDAGGSGTNVGGSKVDGGAVDTPAQSAADSASGFDDARSDAPMQLPLPPDASGDVSIPDTSRTVDIAPSLADGEPCSGSQLCRSGHCIDGVCCVRVCDVCQRCAAPGGTCQSIAAGQPDNSPAGACNGAKSCDGEDPPHCRDCLKCSDGNCIKSRWDFESGTLEGATVDSGVFAQSPAVGQSPAYLGKQSLAMTIPVEFTSEGDSFYARFHVCSTANTANLRMNTFRARVFLETLNPTVTVPFWLTLFSDQQVEAIAYTPYSAGAWVILEGKLPAVEDGKVTDLILSVGAAHNPKWSGRVWVDDVRIE